MKTAVKLGIGGGLLVAAAGLAMVMAEPPNGPPFIPGGRPVTEDQVPLRLQSDGWSDTKIFREGRYIEAVGSKNGNDGKLFVDPQTGCLAGAEEDDDD
jgi:hypothetical protein